MTLLIRLTSLVVLFVVISSVILRVHAEDIQQAPLIQSDSAQLVEEHFRATFSRTQVNDVRPSPIPGLYEIDLGKQLIYFYPGDETTESVLIYGEMFDDKGRSLTSQSIHEAAVQRLAPLNLDRVGITLGAAGPQIIEVSDPECAYCKQLHAFYVGLEPEASFRRTVIFASGGRESARAKVQHIVCSDNKEQAIADVFDGRVSRYRTCKGGMDRVDEMQSAVEALGVGATPALLLDGRLEVGYQPGKLLAYIRENQPSE